MRIMSTIIRAATTTDIPDLALMHAGVRRLGVASKLLQAATQHCRSNGVIDVVYEANLDETVHALFARQGFRPGRVVLQRHAATPSNR